MKLREEIVVITVALGAIFTGALGAGCNPDCVDGKACVCEGGSCDYTCGGESQGGCDFECTDGASCTASCPGGGCTMECHGADSCALDCPGDSCTLSCEGTDSCQMESCETSCPLDCGGASFCSNSCDIMSACPTNP